jgi:amidase
MTMKDQFDIAGVDSSLGYVGRAFKPAARDCVLVSLLKQMGAIIIAKSNLPQSIMVRHAHVFSFQLFAYSSEYQHEQWCETENPLWGLTVHPDNPAFTPGGSTGGEGTLLSLWGSVVGWGTDIGGSIRIPSHMNGLYGLKPSVSDRRKPCIYSYAKTHPEHSPALPRRIRLN